MTLPPPPPLALSLTPLRDPRPKGSPIPLLFYPSYFTYLLTLGFFLPPLRSFHPSVLLFNRPLPCPALRLFHNLDRRVGNRDSLLGIARKTVREDGESKSGRKSDISRCFYRFFPSFPSPLFQTCKFFCAPVVLYSTVREPGVTRSVTRRRVQEDKPPRIFDDLPKEFRRRFRCFGAHIARGICSFNKAPVN